MRNRFYEYSCMNGQCVRGMLSSFLTFTLSLISPDLAKDAVASGWTHQMPDANRIAQGIGLDLSSIDAMDIPLSGTPLWLVSETYHNGILWVATLEDGRIQAFKVANGQYEEIPQETDTLPPGMPPVLFKTGKGLKLWSPPNDASPWTHGVPLKKTDSLAYINKKGELVFHDEKQTTRINVNALPDARLLLDERQRILLLTGPTERYPHGVLGDRLEADSLTLLETTPQARILKTIKLDPSEVIEGIAPIWVDVDGDGIREIIVTVSASGLGARLRVYRESGEVMAESSAIGRSYRWRNQASVFDADGSGKLYLTDVLTPHIGGTLEFFEWRGDRLELAASLPRFTSHWIGSRNLDLALAGPFGSDGQWCMVLPNNSRGTLTAVGLIDGRASTLWTQLLDGILSTNLSASQTPSGTVALGLGTSNGKLRIWQPEDPIPHVSIESLTTESSTLVVNVNGILNGHYNLQTSNDLVNWNSIGNVQLTESSEASVKIFMPDLSDGPNKFIRAQKTQASHFADVQSVDVSGNENATSFQVTVSSPDTGCEKYADWWEVITEEGNLLYRRVLLHSHVNEQPFRRSGGIVDTRTQKRYIIRAHMNDAGYGGWTMIGNVENGFKRCLIAKGFAMGLETMEPLPENCGF